MKMTIKNEKIDCSRCGKPVKQFSKINLRVTDPWRHYKGSGRNMIHTYGAKLCKKCHGDFINELYKF